MFERFFNKKEKIEVYCQYCGKDLTLIGGDVAQNKKIYCHGDKPGKSLRCMENACISEGMLIADYRTSEQVQGDIKRKKLMFFGNLEKSV